MVNNKQINKVLAKYIKNKKVLLAYSGGPDSTFLLESLASFFNTNLKDNIVLAYVNYHDSDYTFKEEQIVSEYTKKYHLNRYQLHVRFNKEKDHNFEEWARNIRYTFFKDICEIEKIAYLIVGHHKDDLIETYILQKERNISPAIYGLKEITEFHSYNVVRPLLSLYKDEIKTILNKKGLVFYDDITNYYEKNTRNKIRNKGLSIKEKDKIVKKCKKENKKLDHLYLSFNKVKGNNLVFYQRLTEDNKKRYIFYLLNSLQLSVKEKEGFLNITHDYLKRSEKGVLNLGSNYKLVKEEQSFFITNKYKVKDYSYIVKKPGIYEFDFFKIDLTKPELFNIKSFPIVIRKNKKEDKISTNLVSKDVHSFIKKQKVPIYLREIYPVFLNDNKEIFYVPFYIDIKKGKTPIYFY